MQYPTSAERDTLFAISSAVSTRLFAGARTLAAAAAFAAALAGCSGGSGPAVEQIPGGGGTQQTQSYNGPAPNTPDVQSFKINLWDNIRPQNRCGTCHSVEGGQTPMFARSDDVNLAYAAANSVVTLDLAEGLDDGRKVGGGQLLAREQLDLRDDSYHVDYELGRRARELGADGRSRSRRRRPRPGFEQELTPTTRALLLREHGLPGHSEVLLESPLVELGGQAAAFFAEGARRVKLPEQHPTASDPHEAAEPKMDLDNPANSRLCPPAQ
jgi:hypothetical protein